MKNKIKEFGYGLISLFLFQIALSIVSIKTSINFLELNNYTGTNLVSSLQLILEIIISLLLIISIIIFIFKRKAGLIIYIFSIVSSILLSLFFSTLTLENLLFSLLIPALTFLLIYVKRKMFFNI